MDSIYEQIGGRDAVTATVEIFYARVIGDALLAPYFAGRDMRRQKAHMRAFLAVALGGPAVYAGRDMRAAHAGLQVTHDAFGRVVEHVVWTLDALGVPPELIEAIGGRLAPLRAMVVEDGLERAA